MTYGEYWPPRRTCALLNGRRRADLPVASVLDGVSALGETGNTTSVSVPTATAAQLSGLRQDIRDLLGEMQLSELTAGELRDVRAALRRARKRILAGKVIPLRMARGRESASAHTQQHGLAELTIDELYAELERRADGPR